MFPRTVRTGGKDSRVLKISSDLAETLPIWKRIERIKENIIFRREVIGTRGFGVTVESKPENVARLDKNHPPRRSGAGGAFKRTRLIFLFGNKKLDSAVKTKLAISILIQKDRNWQERVIFFSQEIDLRKR